MKNQLLNNTLRVNALFSFLSGLDFILFDRAIMGLVTVKSGGGLWPTGVMLIGFSIFVFWVSLLKDVNKYLVGSIIAMDITWIVGSATIVIALGSFLTGIGYFLIVFVAAIIGMFAYFQTKGLLQHLAA
jgi:hypothetical protein